MSKTPRVVMSYSSFRRPLLKPLLPYYAKKEEEEKEETSFDLLFSSSSSSSSSSERERERGEREVSSFFFFFSLFFFSAVEETRLTFSQKKGPSPRQQRREKKWNCLEARDRHRTSISPRSLTSSTIIRTASPGKETRAVRRTVMRPRSGRCEASYRPRICA